MAEPSAKRTWTEESVPEAKRTWMDELDDASDRALMDESEDEAMPDSINKEPFNPFGYGNMWALSLFQTSY